MYISYYYILYIVYTIPLFIVRKSKFFSCKLHFHFYKDIFLQHNRTLEQDKLNFYRII